MAKEANSEDSPHPSPQLEHEGTPHLCSPGPLNFLQKEALEKDMIACNINLIPGSTIKIEGDISPDSAKQNSLSGISQDAVLHVRDGDMYLVTRFKLKLGKDYFNIGMHINPIFNYGGEEKVILYSYMTESIWREERKLINFTFVPGSTVKICINFVGNYFVATLPENVEFHFFNYLFLRELNFFQVSGDFKVHKVTID